MDFARLDLFLSAPTATNPHGLWLGEVTLCMPSCGLEPPVDEQLIRQSAATHAFGAPAIGTDPLGGKPIDRSLPWKGGLVLHPRSNGIPNLASRASCLL